MKLRLARLLAVAALALPLVVPAARSRADFALFGSYWENVARQTAQNDAAAVRSLLADNHDPNEEDDQGQTGLIIAAKNDNMLIAEMLIKAGAHVDAVDRLGNTSLHYAAERNYADMARLLLDSHAAVDPQNRDGMTPLMLAASHGHFEIVQALLEKGASATKTDYTGRDAVDWAADSDQTAIAQLLRRAEARR
ncbi:MAG TPA: ankyrin repeat domain-containing protein [Stellaceae bacterium]|nr:ankyrin repeat domain-containing protein [Stellaceae bacterium]